MSGRQICFSINGQKAENPQRGRGNGNRRRADVLLQEQDVYLMQGYYFSKPLSIDDFIAYCNAN
ncbi:MAG: hypothetical protein G5663_06730 [Serratia symbiotica]|nr:hypothetical protein [Serratia symbiotica]